MDQDVGINALVRYTIQGGILPFLDLNLETAEIVMIRSLQDIELMTPATIVIKVITQRGERAVNRLPNMKIYHNHSLNK